MPSASSAVNFIPPIQSGRPLAPTGWWGSRTSTRFSMGVLADMSGQFQQITGSLTAARADIAAVRREGGAESFVRETMAVQGAAVAGVPDNHLAIRAGGNQAPAIGAEADLINRAAMTIETGARLAGRHIPAAHGLIAGTRHQLLAIRGEGQT